MKNHSWISLPAFKSGLLEISVVLSCLDLWISTYVPFIWEHKICSPCLPNLYESNHSCKLFPKLKSQSYNTNDLFLLSLKTIALETVMARSSCDKIRYNGFSSKSIAASDRFNSSSETTLLDAAIKSQELGSFSWNQSPPSIVCDSDSSRPLYKARTGP